METGIESEALKGYRLSPQQRHLWALLRDGGNERYHAKCAVSIKGCLDIRRLKAASQNVVARHEILRTSFRRLPGMTIPVQVIEETGGVYWREDDLSGADERDSLIDELFRDVPPPFDFERGPLLRAHLIKREKCDYVLILCLPAVCADSVSLRNLVDEIIRGYAAETRGEELNGQVAQYADLAEWQNELIESEETRAGREYWRQHAHPRRPTLQFAFERRPANGAAFEPGLDEMVISPQLTARIESFARSKETAPERLLLACWNILLWRYTGEPDVEVGTAFDGRRAAELESALGLFAKYLPVRCHLEEGLQLSDLLQQLDRCFLAARDRQEYFSWEQIAESPANAPETPFFPFCFEPRMESAVFSAGDLSFTLFKQYVCIDRFKIKLSYARVADVLAMEFHYNSALFRRADIQSLIGSFQALLENAMAIPQAKVCDLEMLTDAERRQLLVEYNSTKTQWGREKFIHELISEQARRAPETIAVSCGEEWLTYGELNDRAGRLASYLIELGVKPEDVVGILMERSPDLVVGLLAILKAGGAYLPLDPSYPQARLSFMLEDAGVNVLLTQAALRSKLPQKEGTRVLDLDAGAFWDSLSRSMAFDCEPRLVPDNLAYVIYTSGSTGRPKGVMLRHESLRNYLLWAGAHYPLEAGCGAPVHSSLSFDLTITSLFTPLLVGGYIHLLPTESETEALGMALRERPGYGLVKLTPGRLRLLAELLKDAELDGAARSLVIGGENLPAQIVGWWRERAVKTRLFNEYGPTESVVGCCVYEVGSQVEVEEGRATVPIGRPIANTSLYILDRRRRLIPKGVIGELYIDGAGLARGYLNRPELTAENFLPSPYADEAGARLYRTGDLARYLHGGQIECLGRTDEQVKIRGYRVEPGEIEARLADHPAVREAVVVARENESGDKQLVGYYTTAETTGAAAPVGAEALREHLSSALPEHMIPAAFVMLDELPLTPNGKLDYRALPAPDRRSYAACEYEAPVGEIETALARIWADLLRVERVGRHDNFFALGGHSLLAVILIERMRREGLHGDVRALFTNPTVAALAMTVGADGGLVEVPRNLIPAACAAITPEMLPLVRLSVAEIERIVSAVPGGAANVQDIYPLAPLQEGILFHHLMTNEGDVYLSPSLLRFDSRERVERFLQALQGVIDRHDILRTAILWEGLPEPVQVVWRRAPLIREEVSLDPANGDVAEQLLARFNPRRYRIDVRQAPLMRVFIAPDGHDGAEREPGWVMLHLFHHLSVDHTTFEVLLWEVREHLLGRAERLPAPLPFRNFVAQARLGVSRREHEDFFRKMLGDVHEPTAPYGLINAQGDGSGVRQARRELDASLAGRMRRVSRALGVSAASLCHLGWALTLRRVSAPMSKRDDVVFGTVLFGRMRGGEGSDRTPGIFINTLPVRIRVGEESAHEGVRQTHALLAQLLRHEHASLALAQRCSAVPAPTPLFSAFLNYRHNPAPETAAEGDLPAWEGIELLTSEEVTNYPFGMDVDDLGEGFALTAQVAPPAAPDRVCAYMRAALERLVDALENAPTTPMRDLDVLPDSERDQLLVEWNETDAPCTNDQSLHGLFERQAENCPESVAVIYGERQLSYAELDERANQLSHYLRGLGVGPEVMVGVSLERSIEMVVGLLAILKAGGAYVPMDPAYPVERLKYMAQDSGCEVVIGDARMKPEFESAGRRVIDMGADGEEIWRGSRQRIESAAGGDNLAYVIYTSGSTGNPKGVMVSHGSVSNRLLWEKSVQLMDGSDALLQLASLSFDVSVWEIFAPLVSGARLVLPEPDDSKSPSRIVSMIRDHNITVVGFVPSLLNLLLEEPVETGFAPLRRALCGGEALPPETLRRFLLRCDAELYNFYGPTEATIDATFWRCAPEDARNTAPIGRPIGNAQAHALDSLLNLVPIGVPGQLCIGGAGLARGYRERPDLTAEMFAPNPYGKNPGARLYKTGDLTRRREDGNLEYLGRDDQQVKIRGFRIELEEIESVLTQDPAVREAVVLATERENGFRPAESGEFDYERADWVNEPFFERLLSNHKDVRQLIDWIDSLSEEEVELALRKPAP